MPLYPLAAHAAQPAPHRQASYPSSMTDQEWAIIQPLLDPPARPHGGRPPKHSLRLIVDAIRYLVRSGGAWRLLPGDFPPWQTVYWWFAKWASDHTLDRVHDALRDQVRVAAGRTPARSAAPTPSPGPAAALTPARRSTAANATWPWTPWGCCWSSWSPPPVCKTATPPGRCCGGCAPATAASAGYGPTAATPASWSPGPPACGTW